MSFLGLFLIAVGVSADAFAVALTMGVKMRTFAWKYVLTIALVFGGFQALMPLLGYALGANFLHYIESFDHWVAFGLLAIVGAKMLHEAFEDEPACLHCGLFDDCICTSATPDSRGVESGGVAGSDDVAGAYGAAKLAPSSVAQGTNGAVLDLKDLATGAVATATERPVPATNATPAPRVRAYPRLAFGSLMMLGIAESIDALAVGITFPVTGVNVWGAITLIGLVTFLLSALAVFIGHKLGAKYSKPAEIIGGVILILLGVQVLVEHLALFG